MTRITVFILPAMIFTLSGSFVWPAEDEVANRVEELTDQVIEQVVSWRRHIHKHPELSNREEQTGRFVAEQLREIGVDDIQTGVAYNGVVALIKGEHPGPCVGLRADMDALPVTEQTGLPFASENEGVMHACGHDCHTAMLLGTAKVLSQMRDEIHGTVKLICQPCEEGAPEGEEGGASLMTKEGVLEKPDVSAVFGMHVNPEIETGKFGYTLGGAMAAVGKFRVEIKGKQTHAAYPWQGVDPVVTSAHVITALQTIVSRVVDTREPAVVTVGIVKGGTRWNIIPESVVLEGTIRVHSDEVAEQVHEAFKRIIHKTAESHGATATIELSSYGPVTWNDPALGKQMLPTLGQIVGEENVVEVKPAMGGEDFAYFAQKVPGFYFFLGVRNEEIDAVHPLHSPKMVVDEAAFPNGVRAMSTVALDYLKAAASGN